MTRQLTGPFAAFSLLLATAFSTQASADTYDHIDRLAVQLSRQGRMIVSETRHYRHTPEYEHLVADATEICRLASHMHEVVHQHNLAHLESDLAQLDAQFHHLETVFDQVERSGYGYGHCHGETSHVRRLLNSMEDGIHHLQDDVRSLRFTAHRPAIRTPIYASPSPHGSYGSPVYGNRSRGGFGFSIGGGSSRLTFRF